MTDPIRAALERLIARLDETTDPNGPVPAWSDSFYAARAALAQSAPPAEGEVEELVELLRFEANADDAIDHTHWLTADQMHRAADLLEQRHPEAMSPTAPPPIIDQKALALAPVDAETTALSRWEAIAADIRIAAQDAEIKAFDYRDAIGNRQARSWVAQLRKLKGSIERARKDAKAVHLERGRAIDQAAKDLAAKVELLIQPHETELLAIEAEEAARIAAHQAIIARIAALIETDGVIANGTSEEIEKRIAELAAIDPSTMEEFAIRAAADREAAIEHLTSLLEVMREQEAQAAELEALRAAETARLEAERIEQARQEAVEEERQRQQQEREAAAWREQQALAAAEAARQAQADAERRAAEAEAREQQRLAEQARIEQARAEAIANRKAEFVQTLIGEMKGMNREDVAEAIVDGSLHPAIAVNWELV